jgi:hypothetical protein
VKTLLQDYWSNEIIIIINYAKPVKMPQDRFPATLAMLQINNNDTHVPRDEPGLDPLYKIKMDFRPPHTEIS